MPRFIERCGTPVFVVLLSVWLALPALAPSLAIASTHRSPQTVPPRHLVLIPRDLSPVLGGGFNWMGTEISDRTAAKYSHVTPGAVTRHGWMNGYESIFVRQRGKAGLSITDFVSLYRTASGARWDYQAFIRSHKPLAGSHAISMKGIGDEGRGFSIVWRSKHAATSLQMYFRRGPYTVRLDALTPGTLRVDDFIRLARVLDRRIAQAT